MKPRAQAFLRWAGSKRQLLPILSQHWNTTHKRYVEPFAGSACLFFQLAPERALLGDINQELIRTYWEIKHRVDGVISMLSLLSNSRPEYLRLRAINPETMNRAERAARFIYLNRFCFNGLYRTNSRGDFNVPYGGERSGNLPTSNDLKACSRALRFAKLVRGDFEKVLVQVRLGDFVYMDPPYSVKARRVFNEYDASSFSETDLVRLRQWMEKFANQGIPFLVSYAESDEAKYLSKHFECSSAMVRRNICGFADRRVKSRELLIFNKD